LVEYRSLPSLLQTRLPGCLIPAYWPVNSGNWDTVINVRNQKPDVPIAVVLSIASGGAGNSAQTVWTDLINRLRGSNIIVLGRVDTEVAVATEGTVNSRTQLWRDFYPSIDGIFFDNLGIQTAHQAYTTAIANYAKNNAGFVTCAGNCKVAANVVSDTWHSQTVPIDTFVVFDGEGLDPVDTSYSKYQTLNNNQLAVTAFGVPALDTSWVSQMSQYIGWIYITNGTGATPYTSFASTYFSSLITSLDNIATGAGGGGSGLATDQWGIRKMYHTKEGGEEFFTNQQNVLADAATGGRIQNFEGENIALQSDGSHQSNGGNDNGDLRLEIWSPPYSDSTQRLNARWLNVECTIYSKYMAQDGRNPPYLAQLYMKGGHHTTSRPCEGVGYKFRWFRTTNETAFDKELCHSNYAGNFNRTSGGSDGPTGGYGNGQWQGLKAVQYNVSNGVKLELYADVNCSDSSGNLVIRNDWKLMNSRIDSGGIGPDSLAECSGCGRSLTEILDEPYSVTDSGSPNFNRNLCAYRTDGVTSRFRYYSAREIDPTKPVTSTPDPDPPPSSGVDQWGIRKIYPTITNGYEWYIDMSVSNPNTDTSKFNTNNTTSKNADGSYKISGATSGQMYVFQRTGYNPTVTANAASNHANLHSRGYMQDQNDFKNVEITGYFRLNNTPSEGSFQMLARGGRHLDPSPNCEGSALRAYIYNTGETLCAKEQWHVSLPTANRASVGIGSILGKWVGIKFVVITRSLSGTLITNQQIWVDINNDNTWTKVDERTDSGGWGNQGGQCGGAPDQLISFGGPIIQYAWNVFNDFDFKNLSVREIDPNAVPVESAPGGNPSLCGS